jgi:hypothetical protein
MAFGRRIRNFQNAEQYRPHSGREFAREGWNAFSNAAGVAGNEFDCTRRAGTEYEVVQSQQNDGADNRGDEPDWVRVLIKAHRDSDVLGYQRPGNAKQGCSNKAARIASRGKYFGDDANEEADDDGSENMHRKPFTELTPRPAERLWGPAHPETSEWAWSKHGRSLFEQESRSAPNLRNALIGACQISPLLPCDLNRTDATDTYRGVPPVVNRLPKADCILGMNPESRD